MQSIPLIDLGNTTGVKREIEKACRDIGFMYVAGHGIPSRLIDDVRTSVVRYFAQPVDVKLRDRITPDNYRGYIPIGFFSPNSGDGDADRYEAYKLHCEVSADDPICDSCDLYGPNKWPEHPPLFKQHLLSYWQECNRVAEVLLGAMGDVLGMDDFPELFQSPLTNMTLLHYPPQSPDATGFGIHPHKVVNTSGAERYSFPYFAVPRFDTVVEPKRKPQPGFSRSSVHVGDVSKEVWRTNWPDVVSDKPRFDLGTLED